jgi:hypothetical protein
MQSLEKASRRDLTCHQGVSRIEVLDGPKHFSELPHQEFRRSLSAKDASNSGGVSSSKAISLSGRARLADRLGDEDGVAPLACNEYDGFARVVRSGQEG